MADSDAWKETRKEGSVRTYSAFAPACTTDKLFGPVVALGHEWIDIESVEYYVWVKSGDQRIDITTDPTAHGTLFPDINMGDVTDTLNCGMDHVKATMSHTLDTIESNVNHQHLLTPSMLTFDWELDKSFMSVAVYQTTHFRYCNWYHRQFSGMKRRRMDNPTIDTSTRPSIRRALSSGHVQVDNPENAEPLISHIFISNTSNETTSSSELAMSGTESSSEPSDDLDV
ncbi:hypothetical protein F4604DRAFT_1925641 [Suillus subluteus]|nr:hypothetical protein F4604DRAFT_1925641 [Suillus subluteus]